MIRNCSTKPFKNPDSGTDDKASFYNQHKHEDNFVRTDRCNPIAGFSRRVDAFADSLVWADDSGRRWREPIVGLLPGRQRQLRRLHLVPVRLLQQGVRLVHVAVHRQLDLR